VIKTRPHVKLRLGGKIGRTRTSERLKQMDG
jgi:hypothetical protein